MKKQLTLSILTLLITTQSWAGICAKAAMKDAIHFAQGEHCTAAEPTRIQSDDDMIRIYEVHVQCNEDRVMSEESYRSYKVVEAIKFKEQKASCVKQSVEPMRAPHKALR